MAEIISPLEGAIAGLTAGRSARVSLSRPPDTRARLRSHGVAQAHRQLPAGRRGAAAKRLAAPRFGGKL